MSQNGVGLLKSQGGGFHFCRAHLLGSTCSDSQSSLQQQTNLVHRMDSAHSHMCMPSVRSVLFLVSKHLETDRAQVQL